MAWTKISWSQNPNLRTNMSCIFSCFFTHLGNNNNKENIQKDWESKNADWGFLAYHYISIYVLAKTFSAFFSSTGSTWTSKSFSMSYSGFFHLVLCSTSVSHWLKITLVVHCSCYFLYLCTHHKTHCGLCKTRCKKSQSGCAFSHTW